LHLQAVKKTEKLKKLKKNWKKILYQGLNCGPFGSQAAALLTELWKIEIPPRPITALPPARN
jgi:hypothetical protein